MVSYTYTKLLRLHKYTNQSYRSASSVVDKKGLVEDPEQRTIDGTQSLSIV